MQQWYEITVRCPETGHQKSERMFFDSHDDTNGAVGVNAKRLARLADGTDERYREDSFARLAGEEGERSDVG